MRRKRSAATNSVSAQRAPPFLGEQTVTEPPFLPHDLGRYQLSHEIAAGGMATVHLGRLVGPVGFARTVAIKRLHPHYAKDPEFVSMFLDEARLAARIRRVRGQTDPVP